MGCRETRRLEQSAAPLAEALTLVIAVFVIRSIYKELSEPNRIWEDAYVSAK